MKNRRRLLIAIFALGAVSFLGAGAFLFSMCSRPGNRVPAPVFELATQQTPRIAFSPDSKWLAFATPNEVRLCNLEREFEVRSVRKSLDEMFDEITFLHDSKRMLIVEGRSIDICTIPDGTKWQSIVFAELVEGITASPKDDTICVLVDHEPRPNHGGTAAEVFKLNAPASRTRLVAHDISAVEPLKFSRDGRLAMIFDYANDSLKVWNTADWSLRTEIPCYAKNFAIDATGGRIAFDDRDDRVRVRSLSGNRDIYSRSMSGNSKALEFHPSGDLVLVYGHSVFLKRLGTTVTICTPDGKRKVNLRIFDSWMRQFAISPDGKFVAASGSDFGSSTFVRIWRWARAYASQTA